MLRSRPFAHHFGLADGHGVLFGRQVLLDAAVEALVLEEEHRVVVADGGFDEALGVVGGGRAHHLQAGRADEPHLGILRMERAAVNAAARGRANHDGHGRVPAVAALGGEVDDLVEAAGDEIGELHLRHRAQAHQAGADGRAHDGRFGDGRIHHAALAEMLEEAGGHFERAAVDADVFADAGRHWGRAPSLPTGLRGWLPGRWWTWLSGSRRRRRAGWRGRGRGSSRPTPRPRPLRARMRGVQLVELGLAGPAFVEHLLFEAGDGVELAPLFEQVLGDVVGGVVRGVAGHAEGLALQQVGAVAGAGVGHGALRWLRGPPARRCRPRSRPACCRPGRGRPRWRRPSARSAAWSRRTDCCCR